MARKVRYELEPETEPELDIAPLIDVSFLLLILIPIFYQVIGPSHKIKP